MVATHDPRASFLDTVRQCPGASIREVARRVGRREATTEYHLRRLERQGLLVSETRGRERAWFVAGCGLCPVLRRAVPALRRPEALRVAMGAAETPAPVTAIAARAGLPVSQARWAAGTLVDAFVLQRTARGRIQLREGAATCIAMAAQGTRCPLWGKCHVSRAWRAEQEARAATAGGPARG